MEPIIAELMKLGLPGLFIAYLLWSKYEADKRYDKLAKLLNDVQDKRAEESAANAKALAESAAANVRLAKSVDDATERMNASVAAAVETMSAATRAQMRGQQ